jgi:hypothetical protein
MYRCVVDRLACPASSWIARAGAPRIAAKELASLRASLPMSVQDLASLIQHVDESVERQGCDHSLRATTAFLESEKLDAGTIVRWLNDHGGYCDCEVVLNVSETLDDLSK